MEFEALVELLISLFSPEELQMFLHMGPQGDRIVGAIELGNSRQRIAYDAIVALREARALDREFFRRLREQRPHRGDEIAALEARWPGDAVAGVRATHVITLVAEVAGQAAAIDDEQIRDALGACDERSRLQLDLHDCGGAAPAWSAGQDKIRTAVQRYLREVVLPSGVRHVSLFGLAPIPWLMTLGHAISETVEARVFQRLRTPSTWTWQTEDTKEGCWLTRQVSAAPDARAVAVLISASARVQFPRVDAALPPSSRAVYEISLARPRIDAVRSEAQFEEFGRCYRGLLDQIAERHPTIEHVHVFAAVPVAMAIDCGRRILHSGDPVVIAYWLVERQYVLALELRA